VCYETRVSWNICYWSTGRVTDMGRVVDIEVRLYEMQVLNEARCRVRPGGKRASRREVPTAHTRGLYTTKMTADSTRDRIVYLPTSPAPSNFENASNTINSSFQRVSHDSGTYTRALIQQYTRPQPVTYVHLVWYISSRYSSAQRRVTMYIHPRYHLPAANPHKSCMGLHICRSEVPGVEEYE
jgi:hypothetical protein